MVLLVVLSGVQTLRLHKRHCAICVVLVKENHNGQGDMNDIKQFDNITHTVADDLKVQLRKGGKVSIAAACFSIYAFEALKSELENIDEFRFIFTSPAFTKEFAGTKQKRAFIIPKLQRERTLYGSDFELRLRNKMSQRAIARECAEWIRRKARFRTNVSGGSVNGFLTCANPEDKYVYMPFNEFTTTELGLERGNKLYDFQK